MNLQLASKMRIASDQLIALQEGDPWLRSARQATAMAARLADAIATMDQLRLTQPVQANALLNRRSGWYRNGVSGALVIDGHVGFGSGPGPLAYIGSLVPGDLVVVGSAAGPRTFRITQVDHAPKGQLSSRYFSAAFDGQLMLITCDYQSPFHAGHFLDNVYVLASPVMS